MQEMLNCPIWERKNKDESIEEFHDSEPVDRGYEDQIIFLKVKNGETKILYSSFNGEGKFI